MSRRSGVIAIAALACALGCDVRDTLGPAPSPDTDAASISGRVLDYRTGTALQGVEVSVAGAAAVLTDSSGLYRIPFPSGAGVAREITIRAHASGYEPAAATIDLATDSIRIPVLFLKRQPTPVVIGPDGGTIEGEGFRIEIPAGALESHVAISAAPTYPRGVEMPGIVGSRELQGLDLQPRGLRFARPAQVTLSVPPSYSVAREFDLLARDEPSGGWRRIGVAARVDGGRSVQFPLEAIPMDEIAVVGATLYYVHRMSRTSVRVERVPVTQCGVSATRKHVLNSPSFNGMAQPHTPPMFNNQYIVTYINLIGAETDGSVTVQEGDSERIVRETYNDHYMGVERGEFWAMQNGLPTMLIREEIGFTYDRIRIVYSVGRCHIQGNV